MTDTLLSAAQNRVLDFGPPLTYTEICEAYTVERLSLWQSIGDDLRMVVLRGRHLPRARLEGKLYSLTWNQLKELDSKMGHGVICHRTTMPVYVFTEECGLQRIWAEIYIGNADHWKPLIEFGSQAKTPTFTQLPIRSHHMQLLNNRHAFLNPPRITVVGNPPDSVRQKVIRDNRRLRIRLWWRRFLNDE